MRNYHLPQIIEYKKKTMTFGIENPGNSLGQAQKYGCVKSI